MNPRRRSLSRNPGAGGGDPSEEYRELALLAERVFAEGATGLAYLGVGATRMSGFRYIDNGPGDVTKEEFGDGAGWTVEVGFQGMLARFAGVAGAVSYSPSNPEHFFLISLSLLLGKISR